MRVAQMETVVESRVNLSHFGNRRAINGNKLGPFKSRPPVTYFGTRCAL
jgi:hypothetical protein